MERWQRYLMLGLAACVAAFAVFSVGYATGRRDASTVQTIEAVEGSDLIQEAYDRILAESVSQPDESALARGAIKGMIETLKKENDPYAFFYSPSGYRSFQELTTGKFSGIGVWLKKKGNDLIVVSVLPSTPALEAGMRSGDVIESVDGRKVSGATTDEAVAMIKGPAGTEVTIGVRRGSRSLAFDIERAEIDLPNLQARLTKENLGYIRLFGFARNAGKQVRDEVADLLEEGAEGVILDLRDNGGGLFSEAIDVASVFIENGEIVTYKSGEDNEISYDATGDAFEDAPLVVLVNEGTASASEIVAGALQDRDRAVVIGTTTYGKGSVQEVVPLSDASAMKFTTAAYVTPDGQTIDGEGITPDVKVRANLASSEDVQFRRAVEILEGIVLSEGGAQG